jgi:hypothetical protein
VPEVSGDFTFYSSYARAVQVIDEYLGPPVEPPPYEPPPYEPPVEEPITIYYSSQQDLDAQLALLTPAQQASAILIYVPPVEPPPWEPPPYVPPPVVIPPLEPGAGIVDHANRYGRMFGPAFGLTALAILLGLALDKSGAD